MDNIQAVQDILSSNISFGILFVLLFFYTIKKAEEREERLMGVIDSLSDDITKRVDTIEGDVSDIKEGINDINEKIK